MATIQKDKAQTMIPAAGVTATSGTCIIFTGTYTLPLHVAGRDHTWYGGSTPVDESMRTFIKLNKSFLEQLDEYNHYFPGLSKYELQEKMKLSAELLLHCKPEAVSLQLTDEGSIFYTVKKNDITLYFQHYLVELYDENDETIVTVFKGDQKILDYGGTMDATLSELRNILAGEFIFLPQYA